MAERLDLEADIEAPLRDLTSLCEALRVMAERGGPEAGLDLADAEAVAALAAHMAAQLLALVRDAVARGATVQWRL